MKCKRFTAGLLSLIMIIAFANVGSFAGNIIIDYDQDEANNIVMVPPKLGSYVGVNAESDSETNINALGGKGAATTKSQLMSSSNGDIKIHIENRPLYYDLTALDSSVEMKVSYNGRVIEKIPQGEKRTYYVKKADTFVIKSFKLTEANRDYTGWSITNGNQKFTTFDDAIVLDLSPDTKDFYLKPWYRLGAGSSTGYGPSNVGGTYDLKYNYNGSFGINTLTGEVVIKDPDKFETAMEQYESDNLYYYTDFYKSADVKLLDSATYQMTNSNKSQSGLLRSNKKLSLKEDFEVRFRANFGQNGGEGMTFFISKGKQSYSTYQSTGYNLGYRGTAELAFLNSLDIEFDTEYNSRSYAIDGKGNSDPDKNAQTKDNHISINRDLNMKLSKSPIMRNAKGENVRSEYVLLEDGRYHDIRIKWNHSQQEISIKVDGKVIGVSKFNATSGPNKKIPLGWDNMYFGFTASTGKKARSMQKISNIKLIRTGGKPHVTIGTSDGSTTDQTFFFETEDAPDLSTNKLIEEAQKLYDSSKEGITDNNSSTDDELINDNQYNVDEYRIGSKVKLKEAIDEAILAIDTGNTDGILAAHDHLKEIMDWFKSGKVTENTKVDLVIVSAETGKVFDTKSIYAPAGTQMKVDVGDSKVNISFKDYDDDNTYVIPNGFEAIDIPEGYTLYVKPKNKKNDDELINASVDKVESLNVIFGHDPKTVSLMCRDDDSESGHPGDYNSWNKDAMESIKNYADNNSIPWKDDSQYDSLDSLTSAEREKKDFLNILRHSLKEEDKKLVKDEYVDAYINDIENGRVDITDLSDVGYEDLKEWLENYINKNVHFGEGFYSVTSLGKVSDDPIKPEGKGVYYEDDLGTLVSFEVPSGLGNDIDPKFNLQLQGNQYFDYSYPKIELYRFVNIDDFEGGVLDKAVFVKSNVSIKEREFGTGYEVEVAPENSDDIQEGQIYAIRVVSRVKLNSNVSPAQICEWYKEMPSEDKIEDLAYGSIKEEIKQYEIQYAIGNIKKDGYNITDQEMAIVSYPQWYSEGNVNNNGARKYGVKLNIESMGMLPGSF